ncbi:MAG: phytanoyl-CoA dioxygenase family protein [Candidatus Poribacteria bacterium]|nr:phytanoyl-CoA dioxygenase family protein [Candidatus Poribacteria bacterium]
MTKPVLSPEQIASYFENGYLHVSGLIPDEISKRGEDAMWRNMGIDRDDPSTWDKRERGHTAFDDPDLVACYTEDYCTAAWQVSEGDLSRERFKPPSRGYSINTFPQEGEWRPHGGHLDHSIKEHGHKTFPYAYRVAAMTYLSDVESHGGATIVWPGSIHKVDAFARSDPEKYEMMWELGRAVHELNLGEPIEIPAKRGDVLLYHVFCIHSGSMNVNKYPRLAMNMKW